MTKLKAPFPWFGGKSTVADLVWDRFGNVPNYVEPFAGSLAVLLGRPFEVRTETVNDLDCFIANFWRSVQSDPEGTAKHADWPVNEADLHARHLWLVNRVEFREKIKSDPDFYDVKIAGWWVWGICQWIGSGWCLGANAPREFKRPDLGRGAKGVHRKLPSLGDMGRGMHASHVSQQIPALSDRGMDAHAPVTEIVNKIPRLSTQVGMGVHGTPQSLPEISISAGRVNAASSADSLLVWFEALRNRLRRVRVCCGDWKRILGPSPTTKIGVTGVFLDPPYASDRSDVYSEESFTVAHDVREWAIANGNNPDLRIALCGYEGEHDMPPNWDCVYWKAAGGYGTQGKGRGLANARKERIWFSPHCLTSPLFSFLAQAPPEDMKSESDIVIATGNNNIQIGLFEAQAPPKELPDPPDDFAGDFGPNGDATTPGFFKNAEELNKEYTKCQPDQTMTVPIVDTSATFMSADNASNVSTNINLLNQPEKKKRGRRKAQAPPDPNQKTWFEEVAPRIVFEKNDPALSTDDVPDWVKG